MTAEWDDLARLAEAAADEAPQEWKAEKVYDGVYALDLASQHPDSDSYDAGYHVQMPREVAKFIAAANPATILRLIEQLRHARSEWHRHNERADRYRGQYSRAVEERDALAARLAAVEALVEENTQRDGLGREWGDIPYAALRAALAAPTDTTKEN